MIATVGRLMLGFILTRGCGGAKETSPGRSVRPSRKRIHCANAARADRGRRGVDPPCPHRDAERARVRGARGRGRRGGDAGTGLARLRRAGHRRAHAADEWARPGAGGAGRVAGDHHHRDERVRVARPGDRGDESGGVRLSGEAVPARRGAAGPAQGGGAGAAAAGERGAAGGGVGGGGPGGWGGGRGGGGAGRGGGGGGPPPPPGVGGGGGGGARDWGGGGRRPVAP